MATIEFTRSGGDGGGGGSSVYAWSDFPAKFKKTMTNFGKKFQSFEMDSTYAIMKLFALSSTSKKEIARAIAGSAGHWKTISGVSDWVIKKTYDTEDPKSLELRKELAMILDKPVEEIIPIKCKDGKWYDPIDGLMIISDKDRNHAGQELREICINYADVHQKLVNISFVGQGSRPDSKGCDLPTFVEIMMLSTSKKGAVVRRFAATTVCRVLGDRRKKGRCEVYEEPSTLPRGEFSSGGSSRVRLCDNFLAFSLAASNVFGLRSISSTHASVA